VVVKAVLDSSYAELIDELKTRIRAAQQRAVLSVNRELILLYWQIGNLIIERQSQHGWGSGVLDRVAEDLRRAFPGVKGFSSRNLKYMRALARAWPDPAIGQQLVAQIPWGHHTVLLSKVKDPAEREFYLHRTIQHGWSRNILSLQIESGLYARQGKAITNFQQHLPPPDSDLAHQTLKDPYVFDFVELSDDIREREVERALVRHVREFLLELGVGFAFVGSQVRIQVGEEDFYLDLLFYHLKLRRYVVIELKNRSFQPADAGQINFYLSAVDDLMRHPEDRPSIGLILCRGRDRFVVEYALRDLSKPIGVAEWQTKLVESLPAQLEGTLPTVEQLEQGLRDLGEPEG
jgi:predicted nuclease of restriction endonuclease-like (RecB) superfamily